MHNVLTACDPGWLRGCIIMGGIEESDIYFGGGVLLNGGGGRSCYFVVLDDGLHVDINSMRGGYNE